MSCCWKCLCCHCMSSSVEGERYQDVRTASEGVRTGSESAWVRKWEGFLQNMRLARKNDVDVDSTRYVFSLMLRLYAHKPVLNELEALYRYRPERFIFYVPQFVAFGLHGDAGESVDALEDFLHDKCEHSLRFSQRVYWFVRSYSPNDLSGELAQHVEERAGKACKNLRGEGSFTKILSYTERGGMSPSTAGSLEDEKGSKVSGGHVDENCFELLKPLPRFAAGPPHVLGTNDFNWAISFFDELTNMGISLKETEESSRNKILRISLESLSKDYLPSDVMFLPVGGRSARIVDIVSSESFCFKTNTRVPFMVCLEVILDEDEINFEATETPVEDLGEKIKETLVEWRSQIRRQFSTQSIDQRPSSRRLQTFTSLNAHGSNGNGTNYRGSGGSEVELANVEASFRRRASSGDFQPMGITSSQQPQDPLGQWTPKIVSKGRGAGFSHFGYHQDFEFETVRSTARKKVLAAQHTDSFTEINLDSNSQQGSQRKGSVISQNSLDTASEDDDGCSLGEDMTEIDLRLHGQSPASDALSPTSVEEADEEEDAKERQEADDREKGVIFRERWSEKEHRVAHRSKYSHLPGWRLIPIIVKSGDDLRQEQFAAQLIKLFHMIFREEGLKVWLNPYDVLAVSPDSGIIQAVPDTISLDSLKKNDPFYVNLRDFFVRFFGKPKTATFLKARDNFCESLAAYCIVSYILQIKDRHNGNILLTAEGHICHIDWGYLLSSAGPGNMNFERAPFKLTNEFVQVLGGPDSACFRRFRILCCKAYLAVRKRREQFILMVEMMLNGESATLPCFQAGGKETIRQLNERFCVGKSRAACITFVNDLIDTSIGHWRSRWYDIYQRFAVGIAV